MTCTHQHIVVTGASSGIGRATALRFAAAGHHVYVGVRSPVDGEKLVRAAPDGVLMPLLLDVTDADQIAEAVRTVSEQTGARLDGLINNAGIGLASPSELVPLDTFRRLLEINLTGQLAVTQAFLPQLRRAHGRIVMIGTIGVRFNPPFAGPLDATKAALTGLADALRQELAPWGVRVVVVEPASINSAAPDKVVQDAQAVMAAVAPPARALYQETFSRMLEVMLKRERDGSAPEVAAETIFRAMTTPRPRAVYLTGKNARRLSTISRLPTPLLDAVRRRIFRLPAPRSLVS
jgi:NAD(P)-dependent dehydrogenase (short-subunit alcohol dehydrogenase family)